MNKNQLEYNKKCKEAVNNINQIVESIVSIFKSPENIKNTELSSVLEIMDSIFVDSYNILDDSEHYTFSRQDRKIHIFDSENDFYVSVEVIESEKNNFLFYVSIDNGEYNITFGNSLFKGKCVNTIVCEKNEKNIYEKFIEIDDISIIELYEYMNEESIIDLPEDFFLHLENLIEKVKTVYKENNGDYKYLVPDDKMKLFPNIFNNNISKDFSYTGDLNEFSSYLQYFKQECLSEDLFNIFDEETLSVSYEKDENSFTIKDKNNKIQLTLSDEYFVFTIIFENDFYLISLEPPENGRLKFSFMYLNQDNEEKTFSAECDAEIEDDEEIGDLSYIFNDLEKLNVSIPKDFSSKLYSFIYSFYSFFNIEDNGFYLLRCPKKETNELLLEINDILQDGCDDFFDYEDPDITGNQNIQKFKTDESEVTLVRVRFCENDSESWEQDILSTGSILLTKNNISYGISCEYNSDEDSYLFELVKSVDGSEVIDFQAELNNKYIYGDYPTFIRNLKVNDVLVPDSFLVNLSDFVLDLTGKIDND